VAVAGRDQPSRVFRNDGGTLVTAWTADAVGDSYSADWFDVDGDGDPDLTLGNRGSASQLYRNDGGDFSAWVTLPDAVRGLAWARWPVPAGHASACDAARW
jgi:hypothetical protein